MPRSLKEPTLGDSLLLFMDHADPARGVLAADQPFHGKVVFVHESGLVNIAASNHRGQRVAVEEVAIYEVEEGDKHSPEHSGAKGCYCIWPAA